MRPHRAAFGRRGEERPSARDQGAGTVAGVVSIVVFLIVFAAMEPVAYATHRWVMHGPLWCLHRSHHTRRPGWFEPNDLFPVFFAACSIGCAVAIPHGVAAAAAMASYGVVYGFVHDIAAHRRLRWKTPRHVTAIGRAHLIHHAHGTEPYGMLWPHTGATPARRRRHDEA